eukprot:m.124697 g.124697  ORF g.124697 m.124697 type:complete len:1973 (+) comp11157_c2_seq1:733-6651(+)
MERSDGQPNEELELLPSHDASNAYESELSWASGLPIRLQTLHSHWIDRSTGVVALRPVMLPKRDVSFIMIPRSTVGSTGETGSDAGDDSDCNSDGYDDNDTDHGCRMDCFRVPEQLVHKPLSELRDHARSGTIHDALINWDEDDPLPVDTLSKFESTEFIHYYKDTSAATVYRVELARFGLEFVLRRSGVLESMDFAGYKMAPPQQLDDTLMGFTSYLVLVPVDESSLVKSKLPHKVVVPRPGLEETIEKVDADDEDGTCRVDIKVLDHVDNTREYVVYDIHERFGELRASSPSDRLLLAALYAATHVPHLTDPRAGMTGAEMAIALVRRSFVNERLPKRDLDIIRNMSKFCTETPTLHLLCQLLVATSTEMSFLDGDPSSTDTGVSTTTSTDTRTERLYETAYLLYCRSGACNPRLLLSTLEERRLFGSEVPRPHRHGDTVLLRQSNSIVGLRQPPVAYGFVSEFEKENLEQFVSTVEKPTAAAQPFPLTTAIADNDKLAKDMLDELKESWDTNEILPTTKLNVPPGGAKDLLDRFTTQHADIRDNRQAVEDYLQDAVAADPLANHPQYSRLAAVDQLNRARGRIPKPTLPELLRSMWDAQGIMRYNRFVHYSDADSNEFRDGLLRWMELCVLEDKLARLIRIAERFVAIENDVKAGSAHDSSAIVKDELVAELLVTRTWKTATHPQWCAFEVDGGIQVRPAQHTIVNAAINNPGAVTQLNMGLGKTRVIVPLLLLHWRHGNEPVRLTLLPALLSEAYEFFHRALTASSVFEMPLFLFTFHRDVQPDVHRATAMLKHLQFCRNAGGAVLMTPASRASLRLKQHEMRLRVQALQALQDDDGAVDVNENKTTRALLEKFERVPCRDIVDESDEALRVKFQLIYAVGCPKPLPSLNERCAAVRMVFRALLECDKVAGLIKNERVAVQQGKEYGTFFRDFRLLRGTEMIDVLPKLNDAVARFVVKHADDEASLRWLHTDFTGCPRDVIRFITDEQADDSVLSDIKAQNTRDTLMALRGLLSFHVLWNALQKRWGVEYGVSHKGRKKLAVPYRAADVPAERSEFAHPDSALVLTTLSYAFDGLSETQVLEAFRTLLDLNPNDCKTRYDAWFAAVTRGRPNGETDLKEIKTAVQLDLTNVLQRRMLYQTYRRCLLVAHFWLEKCVLPNETIQFTQRLKSTAWHLRPPPDGTCVGFSGTNDAHRLLPLFVHQKELDDPSIKATNGRMLGMLLTRATYKRLPSAPHPEGQPSALRQGRTSLTPTAANLLHFAVKEGATAIIDAGALLAGVQARDVAKFLLTMNNADNDVNAVVYFDRSATDTTVNGTGWVVEDRQGQQWPLKSSPIRERDAFVIFDEQHCRGSDMRLKPDTLAVLTLGPHIAKDKLMQAAGRLRQLHTQRLVVTALPDVHNQLFPKQGVTDAGLSGVPAAQCAQCKSPVSDGRNVSCVQNAKRFDFCGKACFNVYHVNESKHKSCRQTSSVPHHVVCVCCNGRKNDTGGRMQWCSRCKIARYCSTFCQKKHWTKGGHKQACTTVGPNDDVCVSCGAHGKPGTMEACPRCQSGQYCSRDCQKQHYEGPAKGQDKGTTHQCVPPDAQMKHVLEWVVRNTIEASRNGLLEWAYNGIHYWKTHGSPQAEVQDERLSLDEFYNNQPEARDLAEIIEALIQKTPKPSDVSRLEDSDIATIGKRATLYGRGKRIVVAAFDEECERELEREEEQQEEKEEEVPPATKRSETDWKVCPEHFDNIETLKRAVERASDGELSLLSDVAKNLGIEHVRHIDWGGTRNATATCVDGNCPVWVTHNFIKTIQEATRGNLAMYLRHVDAVVLVGNNVVLLSDREANALRIAETDHTASTDPPTSCLLHKPFLCNPPKRDSNGRFLDRRPKDKRDSVPWSALARIQLFDSETMFGEAYKTPLYTAVEAVLKTQEARNSARELPSLRGRSKYYSGSHLERICETPAPTPAPITEAEEKILAADLGF